MDWIKKNYDQAILLVLAVALLGTSVWLLMKAMSFSDTFESIRGEAAHNDKVPEMDMEPLNQAKAEMAKPAAWTGHAGSLFVSDKYLVKDGVLIDPRKSDQPLHPPVPNKWFYDNGLDILDNAVLTDDADGDGFSNLDEWKGSELASPGSKSTNPQDKASHPPYVTKLRLVKAISQPFRILFQSYDGDATKPDSLTFQLNTIDVKQPTQFLKLNEPIPKTKFKITKFEKKESVNSATGSTDDVSELTLQNSETGDNIVLVLNKMANSPDSYALFKYLWDGSQFPVKKDKTFTLKPEADVVYKLIDISDAEAHIQNSKTGEKITVPKLEQQ